MPTIYIAGAPRSGSTILGLLLAQHAQIRFVGESDKAAQKWEQGGDCSCGASIRQCDFWSAVMREVDSKKERFASQLRSAIVEHADAPVVVDSSKKGNYIAEAAAPGDLVIHLIRDPRALALSRYRGWSQKRSMGNPSMASVARSSLNWTRRNFSARRVANKHSSLLLRYEEMTSDPERARARILAAVGLGESHGEPLAIHAAGGNSPVLRHGSVEITPDQEWKDRLPSSHQLVGYLFTLPYSYLYSYKPSPIRHM